MMRAASSPGWMVPDWPAPPSIRALSTYRGGGVSVEPYASLNLGDHVGDEPMATLQNRLWLREAAGIAEPRWLDQVHGTQVVNLDAAGREGRGGGDGRNGLGGGGRGEAWFKPVGDAAVTRRSGVVCAILTADCLPVLLATDAGDRVGAAHAGWRGLAAGVIEATFEALGAPGESVIAWLGPAISQRHFEVGREVREEFMREDAGAAAAFALNDRGRYMADLYALARRRLARLGVDRVYGGGECTYAEPGRYFSHRRDGRTGRQATLIWLERRAETARG